MFNKRLREMRMKRGLTQQYIAELCNIALRTYQCYEQGTRTPSYELLTKLADIMDISTDYLLGRDDFMKAHGVFFDE